MVLRVQIIFIIRKKARGIETYYKMHSIIISMFEYIIYIYKKVRRLTLLSHDVNECEMYTQKSLPLNDLNKIL